MLSREESIQSSRAFHRRFTSKLPLNYAPFLPIENKNIFIIYKQSTRTQIGKIYPLLLLFRKIAQTLRFVL